LNVLKRHVPMGGEPAPAPARKRKRIHEETQISKTDPNDEDQRAKKVLKNNNHNTRHLSNPVTGPSSYSINSRGAQLPQVQEVLQQPQDRETPQIPRLRVGSSRPRAAGDKIALGTLRRPLATGPNMSNHAALAHASASDIPAGETSYIIRSTIKVSQSGTGTPLRRNKSCVPPGNSHHSNMQLKRPIGQDTDCSSEDEVEALLMPSVGVSSSSIPLGSWMGSLLRWFQ